MKSWMTSQSWKIVWIIMKRVILIMCDMMNEYSCEMRHFCDLIIKTIITHNMSNSYSSRWIWRSNNARQKRKHVNSKFYNEIHDISSLSKSWWLLWLIFSLKRFCMLLMMFFEFEISRLQNRCACWIMSSKQFCSFSLNWYFDIFLFLFFWWNWMRTKKTTICFHERA